MGVEDQSLTIPAIAPSSARTNHSDQVNSPARIVKRTSILGDKHQELEQMRSQKVVSNVIAATEKRKSLDTFRHQSSVGTALAATEKVVREWTKARAAAKAKVLPQAALLAAFSTWAGWVSGRRDFRHMKRQMKGQLSP